MTYNTETRSSEIARRAILTVVQTPGCNSTGTADDCDPYIIGLFYSEAARLASTARMAIEGVGGDVAETEARWELETIKAVGKVAGFDAVLDPETLKITVSVVELPRIYFEAVS
jgi:hypothetical protein